MAEKSPPSVSTAPPAPAGSPTPAAPGLRPRAGIIPETFGLGTAAVVLFGLALATATADWLLRRQASEHGNADARATVELVRRVLMQTGARDDSLPFLAETLEALPRLSSVTWQRPDATTRYHWQRGSAPPDGVPREHRAALKSAEGEPAGELSVVVTQRSALLERVTLFVAAALAAIVALVGYLLLFRRLRRHTQPFAAIQRNLESYSAGLERGLATLSLSDSLGQIAASWNQLVGEMAALQDQIGQRVGGDMALARFESRSLRQTLDRVPFGVLRFGNDARIHYANAAAARLLDSQDEALVGRALAEALGEECAAPLLGATQRGAAALSVDRVRGENEQRRALRLELIPGPGVKSDAEPLLVIQDVTRLQEAEQARDNFLYHVTHELRTPLTNIQAYAETLSRLEVDDEQTRRECYNVIVSETNRLSKLVEDILSISQLEVGTLRIEWGDVDLLRLLRQMVQDNLGRADEKQISLTLKVPPKVPALRADKQRLAVLLQNLIGNALKYTPTGGRVEVRLDVDERCVRVAIADSGIGIPEADQQRVFEKFYRVACDEVQAVKGTGLGLAIAREIAHLHGGDVTLDSAPGKGSTFRVELPLNGQKAS